MAVYIVAQPPGDIHSEYFVYTYKVHCKSLGPTSDEADPEAGTICRGGGEGGILCPKNGFGISGP